MSMWLGIPLAIGIGVMLVGGAVLVGIITEPLLEKLARWGVDFRKKWQRQ